MVASLKMLLLFHVHIVQAESSWSSMKFMSIFVCFFSGYYFHMELICLHVIINEDTRNIHFEENECILSKACVCNGIFMFSQIIQCVLCVPNSHMSMSMSIMYGFGYS